jgi:hypothetical protein
MDGARSCELALAWGLQSRFFPFVQIPLPHSVIDATSFQSINIQIAECDFCDILEEP